MDPSFDFDPLQNPYSDYQPTYGSAPSGGIGATVQPSAAPSAPPLTATDDSLARINQRGWANASRAASNAASPPPDTGVPDVPFWRQPVGEVASDAASSIGRFGARAAPLVAKGIGWLGRSAPALAIGTGIAETAATPNDDLRGKYGVDYSDSAGADFLKDAALRYGDTLSNIGNTMTFGLPDRFSNLAHGYGFVRTPAPRSDIELTPQRAAAPSSTAPSAAPQSAAPGLPGSPYQPQSQQPSNVIAGPGAATDAYHATIRHAQQNPQQAQAVSDQIERHTREPLEVTFSRMMSEYGMQKPDLSLSRGEMGMLLMQFGLGTMAAAARPGAKTLGAIGEGGMGAMQAAGQLRGMKMDMYQKDMAMRQQILRDAITDQREQDRFDVLNRQNDIRDRNADILQQRMEDIAQHQQNMERLLAPLYSSREGYYGARAGTAGQRPLRNPSDYYELASRSLVSQGKYQPTPQEISEEAQRLRQYDQQGGFGAPAAPSAAPSSGMVTVNGQLYGPARH